MIKEGKLFGKINIFDFLIVVLIIALVAVGFLKFRTFNNKVDTSSKGKIKYTYIINNVRDYTLKALQSGDTVFDTLTDVNIGKITNIDVRDARDIKSLENGESIVSENEYKKDIILTIETPGSSTSDAYFANKSIELKVGSEKALETLYAAVHGRIASIVYSDGE